MNTKDVKDIKTMNVATKKVMSNTEVLWEKEEGIRINGWKQDIFDSYIFRNDCDNFNKYTPCKIIKVKINPDLIKKYGKLQFDFYTNDIYGYNQDPKVKFNDSDLSFLLTYKNPVKNFYNISMEFNVRNVECFSNAEDDALDFRIQIIK